MATGGARKAAMLLMNLDSATAAELLRGARQETVAMIAAEVAYLKEYADARDPAAAEPIREFFAMLQKSARATARDFLSDVLVQAVGEQRARDVLRQVQEVLQARDPFLSIRSAEVGDLAKALKGESATVAALVLSELPLKKSADLLPLLDDAVKTQAVRNMTAIREAPLEAKHRVVMTVRQRLEKHIERKQTAPPEVPQEDRIRKVAKLLRSLDTELRNGLVNAIVEHDQETGAAVQRMMVTWEDIEFVADRPLQEALRMVDARKLALALADSAEGIRRRVRANISERAAAMLDEETSLLSSPKPEDILQAREAILDSLRELNAVGMLTFLES